MNCTLLKTELVLVEGGFLTPDIVQENEPVEELNTSNETVTTCPMLVQVMLIKF